MVKKTADSLLLIEFKHVPVEELTNIDTIDQCFPTFLPPQTTLIIFYRSRTTSILRKLGNLFFFFIKNTQNQLKKICVFL